MVTKSLAGPLTQFSLKTLFCLQPYSLYHTLLSHRRTGRNVISTKCFQTDLSNWLYSQNTAESPIIHSCLAQQSQSGWVGHAFILCKCHLQCFVVRKLAFLRVCVSRILWTLGFYLIFLLVAFWWISWFGWNWQPVCIGREGDSPVRAHSLTRRHHVFGARSTVIEMKIKGFILQSFFLSNIHCEINDAGTFVKQDDFNRQTLWYSLERWKRKHKY